MSIAVISAAQGSLLSRGRHSYARRRPETTILHQVVRENLATLDRAIEQGFTAELPKFVRDELEGFIDCGILSRGFAVLFCEGCTERKIVGWSCKGRGYAERWNMLSNAKREARGGARARQQLRIFI